MLTTFSPYTNPYTVLASQPAKTSLTSAYLSQVTVAQKSEFGGSHIAKGVEANNLQTFLTKNGFELGVSNSSHVSVHHPNVEGSHTAYTLKGHNGNVHKNDWRHTKDCLEALGCDLTEEELIQAVKKKKRVI